MKLLQRNELLSILFLSGLLLFLSAFTGNTFLALVSSLAIAIMTLLNREAGILVLISFVSMRPFLTTLNSGLKITGDLIILSLLFWVIYKNRKNLKELLHFQYFEIMYFIYCIVGILSALITGVELIAIIFQIRAYLLLYFVYFVIKRMQLSKMFLKRVILLSLSLGVILSIQGIIEKISDKTAFMPKEWTEWSLSATNHIRVYGLLKGPNELALYLLIVFLVSLWLLNKYSGLKKVLIYASLTLIGTTFLLTYSRGALLSLAVFSIVYLLVFRTVKELIPIVFISISSVILFFGINAFSDFYQENILYKDYTIVDASEEDESANKKGMERFKETFSDDTIQMSSTDGRVYYVKKAIEVFKDSPIIGTGFGTFGGAATLTYSSPIYDEYEIGFNFYSDNQYILTLAETGVIGVLLLSIFIFNILIITIKIYKTKDNHLSITLLFFFTMMMVGGIVYNILENDTFMLYYFLALGITHHRLNSDK